MKKWLTELAMPVPVVLEACERTIMQLGQPKFSYADTILADWHGKAARTLEAVQALDEDYRKTQAAKQEERAEKHTAAPAKPAKNRFNNYSTGRKWDYDMIEKLSQERLDKSLES